MCYLHHSTAKPSDDRNSFSGPRSASPSTPDPVPLPGSLGSKPNKATNRENHNEFLCFVAAGRELRWSVGLLQGRVVLLLLAALAGLVVLVGVKVPAAKWHRWLIVSIRSLFFLVEHHAPERDGVTGAEGRLDFVRIAPVRPEEDEPVEDGLDVGHLIRPALREDAQQATVLLFKKKRTQKTLGSYHSGLFHTKELDPDSDKIEWNQSSGSGRVPKPSTVINFKATKPESPPPKSPSGTRGLSTTFKVHGRDLGTLKQKRPGTLGKAPFLLLELRFSVSTFFFFFTLTSQSQLR